MKELQSLRSLVWDRDDQDKQMEAQLMWTLRNQGQRRMPVGFATAALLLLCGALFGAVSTTIVYEHGNQKITLTEHDDGSTHITIEEEGETVFDDVLAPGEGLFQVEDESGDELLRVSEIEPADPGDPKKK